MSNDATERTVIGKLSRLQRLVLLADNRGLLSRVARLASEELNETVTRAYVGALFHQTYKLVAVEDAPKAAVVIRLLNDAICEAIQHSAESCSGCPLRSVCEKKSAEKTVRPQVKGRKQSKKGNEGKGK